MRKKLSILMLILMFAILAACSDDKNDSEDDAELDVLEVEFGPTETVDVGEAVELTATVTYGDKLVNDADEVEFEYWLGEDQDNSTSVDSTNEGDGVYSVEITFKEDGVYSVYAHTTARDMHTMPKREITVGDGVSPEAEHDEHGESEGFGMHFMEPENASINEDIELMVHLQMDDDPFEHAEVRYEIWSDDVSDKHEWVDAEESVPGEYVSSHSFDEASTYTIQIHVEDEDDLDENKEYELEVK